MNLEACLPAKLRGPSATINKVSAGLSGAGVYRVDCPDGAFVLKNSDTGEPIERWRTKLDIQQLASNAQLAPRIVHVDESRRAVVSEFVVDRSFPAFFMNPASRPAALTLLGRTLRRVHDLPLPAGANGRDAREFLASIWAEFANNPSVPAFVRDAVHRELSTAPRPSKRGVVLSHNDVNPTNLVYDGEHLVLLDWDTAGPNDPYYDLAAAAVFFRMDEKTCRELLSAYAGDSVAALPARFVYDRRVVGVLCGAAFLHLARQNGHPGTTGAESLDSTPALGEFYQQMRAGAVSIATGEGQWAFGLALAKAGIAF